MNGKMINFWKPKKKVWYQKNSDKSLGGNMGEHGKKLKSEARKLKSKWTREGGLSGTERDRLRELAAEGYTSGDDY